jgi:hypothetical protein
MQRSLHFLLLFGAEALLCNSVAWAGPDVIVGFIDGGRQFDVLDDGSLAVTAGTNSCNFGSAPIQWSALPSSEHPVITVNIYMQIDGSIRQLASSWVKHGFFATNEHDCASVEGVPSCVPSGAGNALGPGCSDLYGDALNSDPRYLGPRSRIMAGSGFFVGGPEATTQLSGSKEITDSEKILVVPPELLADQSARYFIEAHYIAADDAAAGNARNNVTFREFAPHTTGQPFVMRYLGPEVRGQPAVTAWEGATFSERALYENGLLTTSIVASKSTELATGSYRYDYVVYNMNSDSGFYKLEVDGVASAEQPMFLSPVTRGEPWSNQPWRFSNGAGAAIWETASADVDEFANAIRWGTSYSFSFVSSHPPAMGKAKLGVFLGFADETELVFDVVKPTQ